MRKKSITGILVLAGLGGCLVFAGILGKDAPARPLLVYVQAPPASARVKTGGAPARKLMFMEITPGRKQARPLVPSFTSSEQAAFSWDGTRVLFAGRRRPGQSRQIFEVALGGRGVRQFTRGPLAHAQPQYLPGGQVLFAQDNADGTSELWRARPGETEMEQLTFALSRLASPTVLQDGRILFTKTGGDGEPGLYLVRPDGTSFSVFYSKGWADKISARWARFRPSNPDGIDPERQPGTSPFPSQPKFPVQLESGEVVFFGPPGTRGFCRVSFDYPFTSRRLLGTDSPGHFHSGAQLSPGKLVVSYRAPGAATYGLYEFDLRTNQLGAVLSDDPRWDEAEPVVWYPGTRAPALPSLVNAKKDSGRVYCLNGASDGSGRAAGDSPARLQTQVAIYRVDAAGEPALLSRQPLRADGSFLAEVPADTPFRIEAVGPDGKRQARCATLWVRPNESRGCIGCHAAPNLAPDNLFLKALGPSLPEGGVHLARKGE